MTDKPVHYKDCVELADALIARAEYGDPAQKQLDATLAAVYLLRALVQWETGR
jgi:hypothetical protein